MKHLYITLFFILGITLNQAQINILEQDDIKAQKDVFIGVSYGTSDVFRKEDKSHYNYNNNEFGIFALKQTAWKRNSSDAIKKFWFIQPEIYYGNYTFYADQITWGIFKATLGGGLRFAKMWGNTALHTKFSVNAGYQSGYYHRLEGGIHFTEKLNFGVEFPLNDRMKSFIDIGAMHVSNANLYDLNRGLEVLYIEFGFQIPVKEKNIEDLFRE